MDDEIFFCPRCGKNQSSNASFCLACGANLNTAESNTRENAAVDSKNNDRVSIAMWIMALGAVIAAISAVATYFSAQMLVDMMISMTPELLDMMSEASLLALMQWSSVVVLFGAVTGAIGAFLIKKRTMWVLVVILCLVTAFIGFIFCLISAYMVYKAKAAFED
ncbi:MAG: zinc ribbon domain-containing protein [Methanomassiliicoccaceae archaeon]|nr:zinc ribbon domain-containing protein [Methanomassiliicoccaceae archaeon]